MIRLAWLDTADERDVPHVVSDPQPTVWSGIVTEADGKDRVVVRDSAMASRVIRRATHEDLEEWRAQG